MAKLPKYTLEHNAKKDRWDLIHDRTHELVKSFGLKETATAGGALSKAIGKQGGSVKIEKMDGKYQEERTFPRSADPKKSPG